MQPGMEQMLRDLAQTLGMTFEYIWAVTVRQQYFQGVANLIAWALSIGLAACGALWTRSLTNSIRKSLRVKEVARMTRRNAEYVGRGSPPYYTENEIEDAADDPMDAGVALGLALLGGFVGLLAGGLIFSELARAGLMMANPDFYAIQVFLDALKAAKK